jgi:hypothetical protein
MGLGHFVKPPSKDSLVRVRFCRFLIHCLSLLPLLPSPCRCRHEKSCHELHYIEKHLLTDMRLSGFGIFHFGSAAIGLIPLCLTILRNSHAVFLLLCRRFFFIWIFCFFHCKKGLARESSCQSRCLAPVRAPPLRHCCDFSSRVHQRIL